MKAKFSALVVAATLGAMSLAGASAFAQVAGGVTLGVTVTVNENLARGWSAQHTILGHKVLGDGNKVVGRITDLIIDPEKQVSTIILRVGAPLPFAGKLIAIPVDQLKIDGDQITLPGATVENLKATPAFEYAR